MYKLLLILSVLLLFSQSLYSASHFQIEHLISLAQRVQSLDELIPHLPQSLRRNFTLQYQASGLQQGSFKYPRVVLFGNTGQLILTFNGNPKHKGYHDLEVLQFDKKKNTYNLFNFHFSQNRMKRSHLRNKVIIERNPKRCLGCHASEYSKNKFLIHPNFSGYNVWKGFYGSRDDNAKNFHEKEETNLTYFHTNIRNSHPRYKYLLFHPAATKQPLSAPYHKIGYSQQRPSHDLRPNLRLMNLLFWNNSRSLSKFFKTQSQYKKVLPLILFYSSLNPYLSRNWNWEINFNSLKDTNVFKDKFEFINFKKKLYSLFNKKPLNKELRISYHEFFKLFGLKLGNFKMEVPGSPFQYYPRYSLGLNLNSRIGPLFLHGSVVLDFLKYWPEFKPYYKFYSNFDIYRTLYKKIQFTAMERNHFIYLDKQAMHVVENFSSREALEFIRFAKNEILNN
jgi:hypothetical protein